jgi:hypothetical protein
MSDSKNSSISSQVKTMETPSLVRWMRFFNICNALIIIAAGVLSFLDILSISTAISGIFVILFGGMFLCFESQISSVEKLLVENFGFMFKAWGRFMFFLFMGMLCFGLGLFGYIAGGITVAGVIFNIYVINVNPAYYAHILEQNKKLAAKGRAATSTVTEDFNKGLAVGKVAVTIANDPVARGIASAAYDANSGGGGGLDSDPNWFVIHFFVLSSHATLGLI